MNSRLALCAAALGATLLVADDASAKGGNAAKNQTQTIEMTRPAGASDADAQGTVAVSVDGAQKVIHLSKLQRRTKFEIRDSGTGAVLGVVKTNAHGKATFDLTKSLAKAAATNGADAGAAAGDVSNVDVVDTSTGDTVLTGDTTPTPPSPAEGFADYSDDAGDFADAYLSTDGAGVDTFSFDFYPAGDPNADPTTTTYSYYDVNLDTSNGDALPLGVASVTDLAGRAFEVHAADGTVVLSDNLPDLQTDDSSGDDGDYGNYGDFGGFGDFGGYFGGCPGMGDSSSSDTTGADTTGSNVAKHRGGTKSAKKSHGHAKQGASDGFSLFIADANGDLQNAGDLVQETQDFSNDFPSFDPGQGFDPFSSGGNFTITIQVTFAPTDGTFDFGSFFDSLFSGNFDPSQFGGSTAADNSGSSPTKHHRL